MEPTGITHFESPECVPRLAEAAPPRAGRVVGRLLEEGDGPCQHYVAGVRRRSSVFRVDRWSPKRVDDEAYTIRFTPRRSGSTWSLRNIERYEALDAEGRVEPAGAAAYRKRMEENSGKYSFEQETPATLSDDYMARLQSDEVAWA